MNTINRSLILFIKSIFFILCIFFINSAIFVSNAATITPTPSPKYLITKLNVVVNNNKISDLSIIVNNNDTNPPANSSINLAILDNNKNIYTISNFNIFNKYYYFDSNLLSTLQLYTPYNIKVSQVDQNGTILYSASISFSAAKGLTPSPTITAITTTTVASTPILSVTATPVSSDSANDKDIYIPVINKDIIVNKDAQNAITTTNTVTTSITLAPLITPLLFGFTGPKQILSTIGIIILGRKRKPKGIVYDSLSQKPVAFAIVQIIDANTGKYLKDQVTDFSGRFSIPVDRGRYHLLVKAQGYGLITNKSKLLSSDIYSGEILDVKSDDQVIALRIPITPINIKLNITHKIKFYILRHSNNIFKYLTILGFLTNIIALIISFSPIDLILAITYIFLLSYFLRQNIYETKSLGYVYDVLTNERIKCAFVRLLDKKGKQEIQDMILTDDKGRYILEAERGAYTLKVNATNYSLRGFEGKGSIDIENKEIIDIFIDNKTKSYVAMERMENTYYEPHK